MCSNSGRGMGKDATVVAELPAVLGRHMKERVMGTASDVP